LFGTAPPGWHTGGAPFRLSKAAPFQHNGGGAKNLKL